MELIITNREELKEIIHQCLKEYLSSQPISNDQSAVPEKLLNTSEICEYLGITPQTFIRYKKKYKIPFIKIGNSFRFDKSKVIKALEKVKDRNKSSNYKQIYTDELSDYYLKARLRRKGFNEPELLKNNEILELQRSSLKLKREIKETIKNSKTKQND
jgi:excisionase family DNA binding protein